MTDRLIISPARLARDPSVLGLILPVCQEIQRRKNHPGLDYVPDDDPGRNQLGFHKSLAPIRLVFGGNRSGKSRAAAQEIKWWLEESHPHQGTPPAPRIYVISANYRVLREGIFEHLQEILFEWEIDRYGPLIAGAGGDLPHFIRSRKGGQVDFISGEGGEQAREKLQAASIDLAVIDEEITGRTWVEIQMRCLTKGGKHIISATLEKSEEWLLKLEDSAERGDKSVDLYRLDTSVAARRGHLDCKSFERIKLDLSDDDAVVRIEGKSRRRMGLVYQTFGRHHIVDPFPVPEEWTRYCAIDPGFRTCAILWGAVAPDGRVYIYREGYFHAKTYHVLAEFIFEAENYELDKETNKWLFTEASEPIRVRWIDPAGYQRDMAGGVGVGSMLAADYGIQCAPANNSVHVGIERVKRLLLDDMVGNPRMSVFSSCVNLIREFSLYRWAEDRGTRFSNERKDVPIKRNDHALDALRYMITGGVEFSGGDRERAIELARQDRHTELDRLGSRGLQDRMKKWWNRRNARGHRTEAGTHAAGLGSQY